MKSPTKITLAMSAWIINMLFCVTCFSADFGYTGDPAPATIGIVHNLNSGRLYIGTSTRDITPKLPAALDGQMNLRVATTVESPLTANVIVLDSKQEGRSLDVAVLVSCDLVAIPHELRDMVRKEVASRIPDLDTKKIIINATHTHTGAVLREGSYDLPDNVTDVKSYQRFFAQQVADAIKEAWDKRKPGSVTWGTGYAKVAYNRRAVYADGTARMYGATNTQEFRAIEGVEDQSVNSLFFWGEKGKLIAICINVASPAQIVESRSAINADYWHPVREKLRQRFGKNLCVLGLIGAAGDQTPRPMYNNAAEERMLQLRNGKGGKQAETASFQTEAYLNEIANRIVSSVVEAYDIVKNDHHSEPALTHAVNNLDLPMRIVTKEEYEESKKIRDEHLSASNKTTQSVWLAGWHGRVVSRFEDQATTPKPVYNVEVHAIRIGDVALCTNPFELYTEFGVQMKARSKALQTFIVQLAGPGSYLPTKEAVRGGHYSAVVQSNIVGPEGGQVLVDRTIEMINGLWP